MTTNKKRWGDRRDAVWLRDLDALHVFMPYLYPNRADNEAFISETIDLENIDRYLAEKNAALPDGEEPYKLFYLLLSALVKTITLRPKMNRFIKGGRVYQRDKLSLAFVVKSSFAMTRTRRWPSSSLMKKRLSMMYAGSWRQRFTNAAAIRLTTRRREWICSAGCRGRSCVW